MTTADKREYVDKNYPDLLLDVDGMLEDHDYRTIDAEAQKMQDIIVLQYLITWLCDELVRIYHESLL